MKEDHSNWKEIYKQYLASKQWLESLIIDVKGEKYSIPKTEEDYKIQQEIGLERTKRFSEFLGFPENSFKSIHVAGTGGKGSVTMMIEAILRLAGKKTAAYTSPYLQVPNEKLAVDGRMIRPSELSLVLTNFRQVYEAFAHLNPTLQPLFGEAWVALTFSYFKNKGVQWAVIETGMGGRFDPTNIIKSELAVITNIDLDHVPQLGTTIAQIARHKAGIIKQGKPVVLGEMKQEALEIILVEAQNKNSPLFIMGKDYQVQNIRYKFNGMVADIHTPFGSFNDLYINLVGKYQAVNAATAIMSALAVGEGNYIEINEPTIRGAMKSLNFQGRMERMQNYPLVLIDGAHNPQKMRAAAQSLQEQYPNMTKTLVIGMLKTKDIQATLSEILPFVDKVIATQPKVIGKPAYSSIEIFNIATRLRPEIMIMQEKDIVLAVQKGKNVTDSNGLLFITGSIYMLEQVRSIWCPIEDILKSLEYRN